MSHQEENSVSKSPSLKKAKRLSQMEYLAESEQAPLREDVASGDEEHTTI
jgi:hypothetical protein